MKKEIVLFVTFIMMIIVGCSDAKRQLQPEETRETVVEEGKQYVIKDNGTGSYSYKSDVKKSVVEETEYYSIVDNGDYTYAYRIMDKEGKVLLQDDHCVRTPYVEYVNDEIVGVTIQAGTGQSTNWAKYCNVQTGRVSEAFQYVLGEQDEYVIQADREEERYFVTVQNMFDKSSYYNEYELENVSLVAADFITGFEVVDNGEFAITYLVGDSYEEKELTIKIP